MQNFSTRARSLVRVLIVAAVLLPAAAWAQPAFTTQAMNLRAGPDASFPLVAWVPGGAQVNVIGCINGWTWCDVQSGFNRGWAFSQFLSMPFQNQPVIIGNAGGWLGVPLIAFSVGPYWDIHYRNRPWWGYRNQWVSRPPPPAWGPPQGPNWRPPPGPGWRPPPNNGRPPNWNNPGNGRPPNWNNPGNGRPPSGGNPGGGRPPSGGNPGGGRPPSGGNPGGGRPPDGGSGGGGRPPGGGSGGGRPPGGGGRPSGNGTTTAPNSSQGPN